jgi:hypothetical protein
MSSRIPLGAALALALILGALAASPADAQIDPAGGFGGGPLAGTLTVTVIDELSGAPIADAFCQVGTAPGSPFAGNLKTTSASGQVVFTHASLTGPQTVTAGKSGYSYFTIFGVNASQMIIPIGLKGAQVPKALYQGNITSGFNLVSNDGQLDVAVVLPSVDIGDITSLSNFGQFAPYVVEDFPGAPGTQVPGNLYMPTQVELLFAVIDRTPYYLWLEDQTTQDLFAFYGRISLATLISVLISPDPDLLTLIQEFDLKKVGIAENVAVNGPDTRNFTLTNTVDSDLRMRVANTPAGTDVFLIAAADLDSQSGLGRLVPCGFDGVAGGTSTTRTVTTIDPGGAFASQNYVGAAIASDTTLGLANTFVVDRTGLDPGDTADLTSFFVPPTPTVAPSGAAFSWTSVQNGAISPAPDVYFADIALTKTIPDTNPGAQPGDTLDIPTTLWEFVVSGTTTAFTVPSIGPNIPPGIVNPASTPDQDRLDWTIAGVALELAPSFSYNDWDLVDRALHGTHVAWNGQTFIPFASGLYTGVPPGGDALDALALGDAQPNPFRDETRVALAVPPGAGRARLAVFDAAGRRVRVLLDGASGAGRAAVVWDGRDDSGRAVAPGNYLLRLEAGGRTLSGKVTRLR